MVDRQLRAARMVAETLRRMAPAWSQPSPHRPHLPINHLESRVVELDGRVIAIAGASGNLGPTVLRRLGRTGAVLELGGRNLEQLDAVARETGIEARGTAVDLLDAEAANGWAEGIAERRGRVDGLVHLVGGWRGGKPIEEAPLADWDFLHDLLIRTVQHATQAFAPRLLESGRGRFVIVSAGQAQSPTHTNAAYASAKAAAETWTLALAHRFKGTGATANVVVVGSILTPEMREQDPDKNFSTFTPAEEIAEAVAYLCSDAAASMNGQRLTLRGAA
jgi:NAD(P)-dependent dehydrogenase (short-subunit alcohol dehydrogenase family)